MYFMFCMALKLFLCSCENKTEEILRITRPEQQPVETAGNVKVIYSDSAFVKAQLKAPVMNRFEGSRNYTELPQGVELVFFNRDLEQISRLTSNYAISYDDEKTMEARNHVVVVNEKGETLNTEHLVWDEKSRKIFSDQFARITTRDEIIYGDGFEANEDFSVYRIKNVKGIIRIKHETHAPLP